jgi:ferredoxin
VILEPHPSPDLLEDLREAENLCPTQAIRVEISGEAGQED